METPENNQDRVSLSVNIKEQIKKNQIIIFIIPNKEYSAKMDEIITDLSGAYSRICYVSLNKPYNSLVQGMKKRGIDTKKFFFIDCITKTNEESGSNVIYITSPKAFTELSIMINKTLEKHKIESLIFDSLSTMLNYERTANVIRFAQSIITTLRTSNSGGVFTCLKEDLTPDLKKNLNMFADNVVVFE